MAVMVSRTVAPGSTAIRIGTMLESIDGVDFASLPRRAVTGRATETSRSPVIRCRYSAAVVRTSAGAEPAADWSAAAAASGNVLAARTSELAAPAGRPASPAAAGASRSWSSQ